MSEDRIWRVAQSVGFDDYELRPMLEAFAAALSKPAQSPQPAVPVVSDGVIGDALGHPAYQNGFGKHPDLWNFEQIAQAVRAILALRPAVEPMTDEQREALAALVVGACEHKTRTLLALRAIEATEAQYGIGITTKAEDAHQPTKEAE